MPFNFTPHFERALAYTPFLERFATVDNRERWQKIYDHARLTPDQLALLQSFRRKMPVVCMAGPWCGDCVNACPLFQKMAEARPDLIDLRFINRTQKFDPAATDPDSQLAAELHIAAAPRVPQLVFFTQDMFEVERFGERTLATYRRKVAAMQGATCSTGIGGPDTDAMAQDLAEWFTHFERVQLLLLTSPRLMKINGEL